ncbi:hypothetical protein ACWEV3_02385 [Saccharopolyspora sp. NPDC003752]
MNALNACADPNAMLRADPNAGFAADPDAVPRADPNALSTTDPHPAADPHPVGNPHALLSTDAHAAVSAADPDAVFEQWPVNRRKGDGAALSGGFDDRHSVPPAFK